MVLSFGAIFLFRFLLRKKHFPLALRILTPIAELFFSLLFAYLAMVTLPSIAHFIFVALIGAYVVLLIDGLVGVVLLLVEAFRKKKSHIIYIILSFRQVCTINSANI